MIADCLIKASDRVCAAGPVVPEHTPRDRSTWPAAASAAPTLTRPGQRRYIHHEIRQRQHGVHAPALSVHLRQSGEHRVGRMYLIL